ncbi:glycosyltransferase family 2 protein [Bradyrhizobium algeriense]|uniref:glycosyltransferase family 2 protein n=1 Tax=Bradyrhizobium algeriense TaxID=634784 RepID=UPI000D3AE960|nr:glycosyltransferase family 2 protein [Bradyrhizobium algeriense]
MRTSASSHFGVVAIGRNEGERLKRCLASASEAELIVYVDSGSTDGSVQWARSRGVTVVALDMSRAFTAARARNAGFARLKQLAPHLNYVQFVDGDCELVKEWPHRAVEFLQAHDEVCAVFGRRRERYPDRSIYNRICDDEWNVPVGIARACGGDVMMRRQALEKVGGYREDFIAGEEPELCVRLRSVGWKIWRIDHEMTLHDAAITRFGQWWLRMVRSGYAFALGRQVHGSPPERLWVWESRRAWIWGMGIPAVCALAVALFGLQGLALLLVYPLQLLRRVLRLSGALKSRFQFAILEQLARLAESIGQIRFLRDRLTGQHSKILEYK